MAAGAAVGMVGGGTIGPFTGGRKAPATGAVLPEAESVRRPTAEPPAPEVPVAGAVDAAQQIPTEAPAIPTQVEPAAEAPVVAAAQADQGAELAQEVATQQAEDGAWNVVAPEGAVAVDVPTEQEAESIRAQEIADRALRGGVAPPTIPTQLTPEDQNAQQVSISSQVYEDVQRAQPAGGQEVQVPQQEGGQGVRAGGQEVERQQALIDSLTPEQTGTSRANLAAFRIKDNKQKISQLAEVPEFLPVEYEDAQATIKELQQNNEDYKAILPVLQQLDEQGVVGNIAGSMLQGAKQELDALVKSGDITEEARQNIVEQARASGSIENAVDVITGAVDGQAPTNRLESRSSDTAYSPINFIATSDRVLGQGFTQRAVNSGILVLNETSPEGSPSGTFDRNTGVMTVNLDRIPKGQTAVSVLLHEGRHAGINEILGDSVKLFHTDLQKLADTSPTAKLALLQSTRAVAKTLGIQNELGNRSLPAAEQAGELRRVREEIARRDTKGDLLLQEDLAYYVQLAAIDKNLTEVGFFRRLIEAIKTWWLQTGVGQQFAKLGLRPEFTPQLAVELAKAATQRTVMMAEQTQQRREREVNKLENVPAIVQAAMMQQSMEQPAGGMWRSGVAEAVSAFKQEKAAPAQWLGWLKNQPRVRQEEMDDLGLEDWLQSKEGSVTKGEVEQFVRDGGVRIEEIVKERPRKTRYWIEGPDGEADGPFAIREAAEFAREGLPEEYVITEEKIAGSVSNTKFDQYQLPGGSNYRELLITIPTSKETPKEIGNRLFGGDKSIYDRTPDEQKAIQAEIDKQQSYTSSHWSEPNVLVHLRFNERTDAEGKRVLLVEEVQSDWHQEGRKKGYGVKPRMLTVMGQQVQDLIFTEGVPNAPLKSTSTWAMLGMKRMIRWAAENGFDKVAWTPGEQQAERYDLSKQVDEIVYFTNDNGTVDIQVAKDGNVIHSDKNMDQQKVADTVGKEIADKIFNGEGVDKMEGKSLSGLDLKVGGEGMRAFYDKMLPNELKKYVKKFGGKVETTKIEARSRFDQVGNYTGPELSLEEVKAIGNDRSNIVVVKQQYQNIAKAMEAGLSFKEAMEKEGSIFAAEKVGGSFEWIPISKMTEVWSISITPQLRDEALAGQLLYSLSDWANASKWFTSSTAQKQTPYGIVPAIDEINTPGLGNKVFHGLVDRFDYVKGKSTNLYRAFDEWKNRQGAMMQEVQRTYLDPMVHLVSRYAPPDSDSDPIRRAQIANGIATPETKYTTVEIVGHQLAARHILEDKVTEKLTLRAAPSFLKELKTQLTPTNVALLNDDIQAAADGSTSIDKLSDSQAKKLFEKYLPSADPNSDLGDRWPKFKRRAAGYSIVTDKNSVDYQEDLKDGFINAHDLYTPQVRNRESFQRIVELSDRLAQHQLKTLQEGDVLTPEAVERLSSYAHFVPLRREAFDYDRELASIFEKPGEHIGKLMTREGSIQFPSAVHVLQNHLAAGFTAASAAARNQMMNKFYDVVNENREDWKPWFTFSEDRMNNGSMGLIRGGAPLYISPAEGNLRAASVAKVINGLDYQEMSGPLKLMRYVNNWIRWSNVSASPAFMLANTPRDYLTARYNLQASDAAEYAKEIGSWKNYKESFKALHKVMVQGVRESSDPQEQQWIELIEDFEKAGGKTSFVEALRAMDGDSWKSFESRVGRREGKLGSVVEFGRKNLEWLENLNITLENVMRLSTYKVMRDKVGKERAAEIARNLTTNFTRRGAHIDTINTWWLFYNATIQGNWQVIQNMFLNPNKAGQRRLQKAVGGTILFAFMIDQLGRALSDDEDNDGISDWDARPDYEKEKKISLPFKVGGVYPSIPAPWVFNVFWRMGGMLGEVKDGVMKPQDAALDTVGLVTTTFNPVSGGTAAQMIAPSSFDPLMQIIENKDFMGNPLGPDGYPGASKRPDAYLAWDSTPGIFKGAAEFVNGVTGGNEVESGKVDWRPSTYKVLADFMLGGLGRLGVDIGQGLGIFPGEHFLEREGPEDIPLVKTFVSAPSDSTAISLYHDRVAQILGAERLTKMYSEGNEKNPEKLAQVQRERAAVLRMVPQVQDVERQIKSLRKAVRAAQARKDSRTEEMLRERIVQLQKRFNQSFARRVGN
jgi:hypothetical protein